VSVSVRVPTPLRNLTDSQAAVSADGGTVGEIIDDLDTRHPGMRERLIDESGELRRFVNLFVDDEDVRFQQGLATPVADGSTLSIVPAVAGGGRPRRRRLDEQPGGWGA
jgi:molybdopterin converting factor small subunit